MTGDMTRDGAGGVEAGMPLEYGGIGLSLPVAFGAFCQLHGHRYRAYALHRLRNADAAEHTVRHALGELVVAWPMALTSVPAAVGWRILRRCTAVSLRFAPHTGPDTLHELVGASMADAAILHHGLGLTAEDVADLMGCSKERVTYWLLTIERRLPHQPALRAAVDDLRAGRPPRVGVLPD